MQRKMMLAAIVLALTAAAPATAQVRVDMSLVTCGQYLGSDKDRQDLLAAWMSGYFNAARNVNVIDWQRHQRNRGLVSKYCRSHRNETLMSAIQRSAK